MMIESQLTVVTPTRGSRPDLLAQCVRSVKEEGLDVLLEHIVVVDGDPKPIENEIANGDLSHDKLTIRGRKEAIPGANQCRNEGLSACECDYVLFLDDDDILARGALKRRLEFAAEHPKNDFWIFGSYMFRDQPGDCNFYHCFPEETNREDLERFLLMDQPWITTDPLWRRGFS